MAMVNMQPQPQEQFTFFYKPDAPNGCYSQWYMIPMTIDGVIYNCCEQYMMAKKAELMRDDVAKARIMATNDPKDMKRLGRTVRNFDAAVWERECVGIVAEGNYHKFTQNQQLRDIIVASAGTTIVEASPLDRIWGIGLGANNPAAMNRATWRGRNLLGIAIMQAHERIIAEMQVQL